MSSVHAPVAPAAAHAAGVPVVAPVTAVPSTAGVAPAGRAAVASLSRAATPTLDRLRYIAGRSILSLDAVPGMRLRIEKGQVWITQSGRHEDHVLGPGDWLLPQQRGLMLVYAFEPAMVAVSMPAGAPAKAAGEGAWARLGRTLRAWLTPAWRTPVAPRTAAGAAPALCTGRHGPAR